MLLILLIFCVNGVNATDISDNSTIGDKSPTICVDSSFDGYVGSGTQPNPYEILSSAVGNADGGETLYVSPAGNDSNSGTRDSPLATLARAIDITETGNIVLLDGIHNVNNLNTDKTLKISGEGNVTIDATESNRIIYIYEEGDVTFSNLEMINGYSSQSGALIGNAGKLTLINTTLSHSISNNNGGAVYNMGTLTIINSIIENNRANLGGAIYSGGSIKTQINIRIVNTTFIDNTALGNANNKGGGAIYAQASSGIFILENVTFENNNAGKYGGGALYAMQLDNIRISDSKFINNSAEANEYYGGGAIAVIGGNYQREGTTTITNTLFENNNAAMSGGAIYLKGTTLDISNSVLVNSADSNGIVVYSAPTVNSVNSKITANDNWWGSNDNPKKLITKVSTVTLNRWAILTIENDTEIAHGNDVNIVVSLCNYTTGSVNGTLSKPITIKRNVSVQTSFEEFDGVLDNGIYNLSYTVPEGLKLISATLDSQNVVLYVVESEASINLGNVTGKKGSKVYITAQIVTSDSLTVNDGYINFYVGSKLIGHVNVLDNNATLIYLIKEDEGIYNLTAEYVSESGAFNASNATAMLNVSGLNNIVREDNFYEFFDEEGIIREGILFDELIFEGEFNDVSQIITIDKPIKITGDDAVLNDIAFNIMEDNVELNNMTFNANQEFMLNYGSIFLVTSNDVTLINNRVNYTAPGTDSYVIYADEVAGLKIINNEMIFANEFHAKNIFTNAIYLHDSNNVLMENNTIDITIPSVDIDYDFNNVFSEGVVLYGCDDVIICDNNIQVKYNSVIGNLDTLRAVNVNGSDNVVLANNTVTAYGHKYVYAIVIDGNNFNLYNNTISSSSDINYANGININGPASGIVEFNTVSAIAPNASYPIYSSGYTGNVTASYVNNMVYGNANDVYGIYVSGTNENLTHNDVLLNGNFTIGIASLSANAVMSNNTVNSLASNIGKAWSMDIIPCVTSGITSADGRCIVDGNMIETTGQYSVDISDGEVTNNYLIANTTSGDKSVKSNASILIENNIPLMKTANLTVNNVSLNVGDEILFNVTLTFDNNPLDNYTVDLYVNGSEYHAVTDIDGIATFEVDSLPAGVYEMVFIVDNRDIVELITQKALLDITLNDLNVNVTAYDICEGENLLIDISVPDNLEKDLEIMINKSTYLIKKSDSIVVSNLTPGKYAITIYYPGDDYYYEYNGELNVTVYEKCEIVVNFNEPYEGEDLIINVTGPKDITGNVNICVGNETFDVPFGGGNAIVSILNMSKGFYPIVISYLGDEKYTSYTFEGNVTVNPKPKENATIIIDAPAEAVEGDNVTVSVTLPVDAVGTVTIGNEVIPVVNGTASAVLTDIPLGKNTVSITYSGDDKYNSIETNVVIDVNEKPVPPKENLTLEATADSIIVGEDAVIVVSGFKDAAGNVSVTVGDGIYTAVIVDGTATVVVPGLIENGTAVVSYPGDDNYNNASVSVDIVVYPKPKKNATIIIDAPAEAVVGDNVTVSVTLPVDAVGTVTIGNEVIPVVNGTASVVLTDIPLGKNTVSITYSGDDKYNSIETNVVIDVNEKPVPPKENLTLEATADSIIVGEDAVIVVSGFKDAAGNVSVTAGNGIYTAPIVKGTVNVVIPGLIENVTAVVSFPGDDKYNNASASVDIVVYPKPKENATIIIDAPSEAVEGDNVTVSVTLPEDAAGTVTIGNEVIPVVNGTAGAVLTNLSAGKTTVPIAYSGDEKYNPIEANVTITVKKVISDIISAPDVTKYFHGSERFLVTVTDYNGNPLANKSVTIVVNGVSYARTTNANGSTSVALGLPSGIYNVTTTMDNQTVNSVVTVLTTVNGTDLVKVFRNSTQYYATFRDSEGNYLAEGTEVEFNINGVLYTRKVTENGLAKLNINLEQGQYIITAINKVTTEMSSNNITVIPRIVENNNLIKYYRNASQYTVKIIGDDGKAVGAGENVAFNINGVMYTRTTNASGIAKMNINLAAGNYVITVEYRGCKVSNNITVLPVITAEDITMKYRDGTKFVATVVDGQGKSYPGQTVTFNINGVLYNRITDASGQAKLNINLMAGEYIITSSYNGANIANTIKITA